MDIIYLLLILLFGSIITFLSGEKWASRVALFFSVSGFLCSLYFCFTISPEESINVNLPWISSPNIAFALRADGLSMVMVLLTTFLSSIIIFSSIPNQFKNSKSIYGLILLMTFAMTGTFLASDGLLYYIFWELSLIPIYFIALIWGNGDKEERKKAVVKFFIYTFAGSLFMLVAFVFLYQKAGSLALYDLYSLKLTYNEQLWVFLAFFLAYAIKIPLIPFHTWQASVYQKAPTVGTMLLSGIMLKMGLYSVIRWQLPLSPLVAKEWMPTFVGFGLAGVIYGAILALRQKDLKKLLAYSSLSHVGLIAAGCYTLSPDGLRGAVLQMLAHGFVVVGLFFAAEVIYRRFQTREIASLGGIRPQTPKFSSMFMIMVLASVALPTTFNFIGEFTVLYSLMNVGIGYAILGGLTIILGAYYMLKMYQNVMLGETNPKPFADLSTNEIVTFAILIAVTFVFGMYADPIIEFITPSIKSTYMVINKYNLVK